MKSVALAKVKDDLSAYLRRAEHEQIVITRHGHPAGVLIGFESDDDWLDYRLEQSPELLRRIEAARAALARGEGVRLEEVDSTRPARRGHDGGDRRRRAVTTPGRREAGGELADVRPASMIEHDDALNWLQQQEAASAKLIVFDPPYAVGTPVRGREDGAAGSVFAPFAFMHKAFSECCRILKSGGIVMVFADWRRMFDLGYLASISGLRPTTCVAWVRNRPGTGGLFRASWDPVLIVSRGIPDAINRAAIRNVVVADYQTKRKHPYGKPVEVFEHVMRRICKPGDLVIDPFAGSGVSRTAAKKLKLRWAGCDVDPQYAESSEDDTPTTD